MLTDLPASYRLSLLNVDQWIQNEITTNAENILDGCVLGDRIGSGTYGDVYKARCFAAGRPGDLAVKIVKVESADDLGAIEQEINILGSIRHENIVRYYDSCYRNGRLWITMEFCAGGSLQDVYHCIGVLHENEIAFACREILKGLCYLHSKNKIHRDIKGANVLLTDTGCIKLADFGVSAEISATISKRKSFIGTPYWMAPEVAAVERKGGYGRIQLLLLNDYDVKIDCFVLDSAYDQQCDVWAVGITSIELAELQPPLFDLHPMRALYLMSRSGFKPPSLSHKDKWSAPFNAFVKLALTKNPKKRPTANQLLKHTFTCNPEIVATLGFKLYKRSQRGAGCPMTVIRQMVERCQDTSDNSSTDCTSSGRSVDTTLLDDALRSTLALSPTPCEATQPNRITSLSSDSFCNTSAEEDCTLKPTYESRDSDSWLINKIRHLFPNQNARKIYKRCSDNLPPGCLYHLTDIEADHIIRVIVREMTEIDAEDIAQDDQAACQSSNWENAKFGNDLFASNVGEGKDLYSFAHANGLDGRVKYEKSTSSGPIMGLPPVPKIHMGACFTKIFNNCPYNVYTAVSWMCPEASGNFIFIGCEEGIFALDLLTLYDSALRKISNKPSTWLYVRDNVLWSLSGNKTTFIYHHELLGVHDFQMDSMKRLRRSNVSLQDLSRRKKRDILHSGLDKLLHHRLNKLSNSRGTRICTVAQCPYSKFLFMVSSNMSKLCLRQYYEPTRQFLLLKIFAIDMPFVPHVFRQLIFRDRTYPLLCMAVTKCSANAIPSGLVLANLNGDCNIVDATKLNENENLRSVDVVQLHDDRKIVIAYRECVYLATFDDKPTDCVRLIFLLFRFPDPLTKIIVLSDSVLTFHSHGMVGKNLKDGQVTQDISDITKRFTVLNDQGLVIMKSQAAESPISNDPKCDLLILMGHKNSL